MRDLVPIGCARGPDAQAESWRLQGHIDSGCQKEAPFVVPCGLALATSQRLGQHDTSPGYSLRRQFLVRAGATRPAPMLSKTMTEHSESLHPGRPSLSCPQPSNNLVRTPPITQNCGHQTSSDPLDRPKSLGLKPFSSSGCSLWPTGCIWTAGARSVSMQGACRGVFPRSTGVRQLMRRGTAVPAHERPACTSAPISRRADRPGRRSFPGGMIDEQRKGPRSSWPMPVVRRPSPIDLADCCPRVGHW